MFDFEYDNFDDQILPDAETMSSIPGAEEGTMIGDDIYHEIDDQFFQHFSLNMDIENPDTVSRMVESSSNRFIIR